MTDRTWNRATVRCDKCGTEVNLDDPVVLHSRLDPLQVVECPACGAVVDIGGHRT